MVRRRIFRWWRLLGRRRVIRRRRRIGKLVTLRQPLSLILLLLILASPAFAATPKFPALTGRVVDDAGILNLTTRNELSDMLAEHEHTTGEQVVVVMLGSLQGFSIEDFGYQLGRYW